METSADRNLRLMRRASFLMSKHKGHFGGKSSQIFFGEGAEAIKFGSIAMLLTETWHKESAELVKSYASDGHAIYFYKDNTFLGEVKSVSLRNLQLAQFIIRVSSYA
jgi:hypothetical protein